MKRTWYATDLKGLAGRSEYNPYYENEHKIHQEIEGVSRTDQVYMGVNLLNDKWGAISQVQRAALLCFRDLLLINGYRSLEFYISRFGEIQKGVVDLTNLPSLERSAELRRHVIVPPPSTMQRCIRQPRYRVCLSTIHGCELRLREGVHLQVRGIDRKQMVGHLR